MNRFKNLKIGLKLLFAFLVMVLFMSAIGGAGYRNSYSIYQALDDIFAVRLPSIDYLVEADRDLQQLLVAERSLIFAAPDSEVFPKLVKEYETNVQQSDERWQKYKALATAPEEKAIFSKYERAREEWAKLSQRVVTLSRTDRNAATELTFGEAKVKFEEMRECLNQLQEINLKLAKQSQEAAATTYQWAITILLSITTAGLLIGMLLARGLTRILGHPLVAIAEAARHIAVGNINQQIAHQSGDEIGALAQAFRDLIGYIKGIATAAESLRQGDLNTVVEAKSAQDVLSQNFARVTSTLSEVIAESEKLVAAAKAGQLYQRGNADQYQGVYRDLVQGINDTLDAMAAPINEADRVLARVAARDLTARMTGEYQGDFAKIKEALNTAIKNLTDTLSQIAVGAEQVATGSNQISAGSQSLAQGASTQASSLQEVASSLQQMSSMISQNTSNAKEARGLTEAARSSAEKGVLSMQHLSSAVDRIKQSSDATAKIVKTIDEIAFQTNLLALNAAVEAARAGDAGKGFAVVAEEVRNLAMRSAEAAKNTANLIEESVRNAVEGVTTNQEVLTNLEVINQQVKQVTEVMAEIAAASEQQNQGIEQINTAITQMNQMTQQTAANAQESAAAAEELSGQSEEMLTMVGSFKLQQQDNVRQSKTARLTPAATHNEKAKVRIVSASAQQMTIREHHRKGQEVIPFGDMEDTGVLRSF